MISCLLGGLLLLASSLPVAAAVPLRPGVIRLAQDDILETGGLPGGMPMGMLLSSTGGTVKLSAATESAKDPAEVAPENPPVAAMPVVAMMVKADHYAELLAQWQQSPSPQSFEPVLVQGQEVASAYMALTEPMDEASFDALVKKMQGYLVLREPITVAAPDPAWLYEQAKQHGGPADIAFFDLMRQTLNGYWPVTMERLDDQTGCTRYGLLDLVKLYGGWKDFQRQYPQAYKDELYNPDLLLLWDIEDQLLNSKAACEGAASVIQEFEAFMQTFPDSNLVPQLRRRLDLLRKNQLDMYFYQGIQYNSPE
ncbi:MAG TPA: hypothetical protein V6C52_10585 [Coleofasciculaceae cyanobacterium]